MSSTNVSPPPPPATATVPTPISNSSLTCSTNEDVRYLSITVLGSVLSYAAIQKLKSHKAPTADAVEPTFFGHMSKQLAKSTHNLAFKALSQTAGAAKDDLLLTVKAGPDSSVTLESVPVQRADKSTASSLTGEESRLAVFRTTVCVPKGLDEVTCELRIGESRERRIYVILTYEPARSEAMMLPIQTPFLTPRFARRFRFRFLVAASGAGKSAGALGSAIAGSDFPLGQCVIRVDAAATATGAVPAALTGPGANHWSNPEGAVLSARLLPPKLVAPFRAPGWR